MEAGVKRQLSHCSLTDNRNQINKRKNSPCVLVTRLTNESERDCACERLTCETEASAVGNKVYIHLDRFPMVVGRVGVSVWAWTCWAVRTLMDYAVIPYLRFNN